MRTRLSTTAILSVLTVLAVTTLGGLAPLPADADPGDTRPSHADGPGGEPSGQEALTGTGHSITLITGDQVHLRRAGDRRAAVIEPAPGREEVGFHQMELDGDLYVFPLDVFGLLPNGRVDRELFNVSRLVEQGYTDGTDSPIPLILRYGDEPRPAAAPPGTTVTSTLQSIDGLAVRTAEAEAGVFWRNVTGAGPSGRPRTLTGGLVGIRLDRKVEATLDRSTAQVNARAAWESGYTGEGATVAVLDTGVDTGHPDLAGAVTDTADFTGGDDPHDNHGHGTHVSSIVAGRGVADPEHRGVAPDADLVVGKVLDDNGTGLESWILDGMEWAANSGADVVNMSLGGGPTTGDDPMSQAVNTLTEQTGTLFVISAGNDGRDGGYTVGAPGTADAALTVGAVDRDESLADFSSRGPRLGDFAIKPEVTAPGVGIDAARADAPADDPYVRSSGTSMAAPHVAGTAAIVAAQRPNAEAEELKNVLASTAEANPDLDPYQQGTGRIDVERATSQPLTGSATVDLGPYDAEPGGSEPTEPTEATVRYRNSGDDPLTLRLDLKLAADAVRLDTDTVDVPAGGTAQVRLTVDPSALDAGHSAGYLVASAESGRDGSPPATARTAVGVSKEAPRHQLTLSGVGRDGGPAFVNPIAVFSSDSRFDYVGYLPEGRSTTIEVAEGSYDVYGVVKEGTGSDRELHVVQDPDLEVERDTAYVFDARTTNQVRIDTPKPGVQDGILSLHSSRDFGDRRISHFRMEFEGTRRIYAAPTEKVRQGSYEFGTRWQLLQPRLALDTGRHGPELTPWVLHDSPLGDRTRRLRVVDVGNGRPQDYRDQDVAGRIALISATDRPYDDYVRAAADAGAAFALIATPQGIAPYTKWNPTREPAPVTSALISHQQGAELREVVADRRLRITVTEAATSTYLYDVQQLVHDRIPERIVHRVSRRNSAVVRSRYHESGGEPWQKEQRFAWRPWQDTATNQYQRFVRTPSVRTEYVSAGDTLWQHRVKHYFSWESNNPLVGGLLDLPRTYRAGERHTESWFAPVSRPAIPTGLDGPSSVRDGATLSFGIPSWGDAEPGHFGHLEADFGGIVDRGSARLFSDGELIGESTDAMTDFAVDTADSADYRLELEVARDSADWEFAPRTETVWSFESAGTDRPEPLPLPQLDYDLDTDPDNRVPANRPQLFRLEVRHQEGVEPVRFGRPDVRVSYDDGESWRRAVVLPDREAYRVLVVHPRGADPGDHVTLRVRASDADGNRITQLVERAYGLR